MFITLLLRCASFLGSSSLPPSLFFPPFLFPLFSFFYFNYVLNRIVFLLLLPPLKTYSHPPHHIKINFHTIKIYLKYIFTENFISAEYKKYIEMYVVYKMENMAQVKKELKEELRAEMRQLRDQLLHNLPPEEEVTREDCQRS